MRGCEADRSQRQAKPVRDAGANLSLKKNNNNKDFKTMTQSIRLWELSGEIQQLETAVSLREALRDRSYC